MRMKLQPHSILDQTPIITCSSSSTHSNENVRPVCPRPTQQPCHTFNNERRSTQSRHRHCSVFGHHMMRVRPRPHTALKTNITTSNSCTQTATQTHELFVQSQRDTRFIHSTSKDDQCKVDITIAMCICLDKMANEGKIATSYCIKRNKLCQSK